MTRTLQRLAAKNNGFSILKVRPHACVLLVRIWESVPSLGIISKVTVLALLWFCDYANIFAKPHCNLTARLAIFRFLPLCW